MFRASIQSLINKIDDYSSRTDPEALKFFNEDNQKTIYQILQFKYDFI